MYLPSGSRLSTVILLGVLTIGIFLLLAPIAPVMGLSRQVLTRSEIGLELRLTGESTPIRFVGPPGGVGSTEIPRGLLRINNPLVAGQFTSLHVQTEVDRDGLRVSLFVIYNDEWDQKEKIGESYLIRAGESILASELDQFGIEPIEVKAIDARPIVLKPGEGPRITNTASLEVEKLERHFDSYSVWLKNKSDKDIGLEERGQYASAVESIKRTLEQLRETFGRIIQ